MIQGNDSKIRQLYDDLFETAAAIVKRGEEHRPILIVLNESDRLAVIAATGLSDQKKAEMFKTIAATPGTVAVVLIHEGWLVVPDPMNGKVVSEALRLAAERRLAEHPQRREVVMFNLLTPTRQAVMPCLIDRTTNTLEKAAFKWISDDAKSAFGRFIGPGEKSN